MVLCWNLSVNSSCNYPCYLALFLTFRVWSTIWVVLLYHWYLISPRLSNHTDHTLLIHFSKCFLKFSNFISHESILTVICYMNLTFKGLKLFAIPSSFRMPFTVCTDCIVLPPSQIHILTHENLFFFFFCIMIIWTNIYILVLSGY